MDTTVTLAVLLAAVLHAGWNALVRAGDDRLARMVLLSLGAGAVAVPLVAVLPVPARGAWPWLAASVAIHTFYKLFLVQAYRRGDLGQVYPIARGAAPLLVAGAAWFAVGETLTPTAVVALVFVSGGILMLAGQGRVAFAADPAPVLWALATAATIAGYTVVDGLGARTAGSAHTYAAWLFAVDALPLLLVALAARGGALVRQLHASWRVGLPAGVMSFAAYWLVIWALTMAPMALVSALRETSVVIAALLGTLFLKEPFGRWRIAASAAVALGVIVLRW
jgi:drug/metabolite transporter (DMT)-like permease